MAERYKALRVPIALLQQKVFPQGVRLEKWEPLTIVKEEPITVDRSRVISPRAIVTGDTEKRFVPRLQFSEHLTTHNALFDRMPYLRRFFSRCGNTEMVTCRCCREIAKTELERSQHSQCQRTISQALRKMSEEKLCAVCDKRLTDEGVMSSWGIPICSKDCAQMWDFFNPDAFRLEVAIIKGDFKREVGLLGTKLLETFDDPQRAGDILEGIDE